MNTITKSECEAVIERLVDKTLSFGCEVDTGAYYGGSVVAAKERSAKGWISVLPNKKKYTQPVTGQDPRLFKILGHPILIGDVLEEIKPVCVMTELGIDTSNPKQLLYYWQECGFTRSLQDILAETEMDGDNITGPPASLFRLLHTIFLTTE